MKKILYQLQKVYYKCKKGFSPDNKKYQKVGGHCNYTGEYRGAGHDICIS